MTGVSDLRTATPGTVTATCKSGMEIGRRTEGIEARPEHRL
jgi:hypothetical protein